MGSTASVLAAQLVAWAVRNDDLEKLGRRRLLARWLRGVSMTHFDSRQERGRDRWPATA